MIEDGCEIFCSYCIVPYVRGKITSKPMDEIISEAEQMVRDGVREIILTGINLGEFEIADDRSMGDKQFIKDGAKEILHAGTNSTELNIDGDRFSSSPDFDRTPTSPNRSSDQITDNASAKKITLSKFRTSLPQLIERLSAIDGLLRIRLSSIEPKYINDDLIKTVKDNPKVCEHFHIPLQSGDDGILKAMNRNYTAKDYLDIVNRIKKQIKDAAITTDIIVGFPGESEQAFKNTLKLADKIGFSRIHIFPYSDRPGTKAEKLPNKIDHKIIDTRHKRLDKLREKLMLKFHRSFKDQAMEVLIEQRNRKTGALEGLTSNYIRVFLCGDDTGDESIGGLISVKFRDVQGENVIARPILV